MKTDIVIERTAEKPLRKQIIEVVERKGLGHPDFMADSIAETYSRNLSRYYIDNFGSILHHNVDKLEVIGGQTAPEFGGGETVTPISIMFSGRATSIAGNDQVPLEAIAIDSARDFIDGNMRFLDPGDMRYLFETKSGASSLTDAYKRAEILSNDTSFGAGYAPMTETETCVLSLEKFMNSTGFKRRFPYSGEDVKVLATRKRKKLDIIVANAFVDRYVESLDDYFEKKAELIRAIEDRTSELLGDEMSFEISLNGIDDRSRGKDGCYLTVTGTSAEHGDDGSVGRGNRVNGLITPNRVMSFEAIAGKNPVNHIGKIYSILAFQVAHEINMTIGADVSVKIVGRIGDPVNRPRVVAINVHQKLTSEEKNVLKEVAEERVRRISDITEELVAGKIQVC